MMEEKERWNDEAYKKTFGYIECPLITKVTEGRITTIDIISCDTDLDCACCSDSRENCEETFLICARCNNRKSVKLSDLESYKFEFTTITEARKYREDFPGQLNSSTSVHKDWKMKHQRDSG